MAPCIYCLAAFTMVYILYDLFENLSKFVDAKTPVINLLKYYLVFLPASMYFIVPVSLLLAVLYSLSQLTRHNEFTAMRASGISLYRLMLPFILVGFLASVVVSIVHETIAPQAAYWIKHFVHTEKYKGKKYQSEKYRHKMNIHIKKNFSYFSPVEKRDWHIGEFNVNDYSMKEVRITQQNENGAVIKQILAEEIEWLDGRWWAKNLAVQDFDDKGYPKTMPDYEPTLELSELAETPQTFLNEAKDPEFLTSRQLYAYIATHQHLSPKTIDRYRVDFHYHLAMPWTCLVLTLLGIPFGNHTGRKGALLGIVLSLGLFFALYTLIHFSITIGKKQLIEPWLAAWGPNLLFTAIAGVLLYRMR